MHSDKATRLLASFFISVGDSLVSTDSFSSSSVCSTTIFVAFACWGEAQNAYKVASLTAEIGEASMMNIFGGNRLSSLLMPSCHRQHITGQHCATQWRQQLPPMLK